MERWWRQHTLSGQCTGWQVGNSSVLALLILSLINKSLPSQHSPGVGGGGRMLESVGLGQTVPEETQRGSKGCPARRAGTGRTEVHGPREQRGPGGAEGTVPGVEPECGPEFDRSPVMR